MDAGLVVLIWMVQLIVYPSFTYFNKENLIAWHQKYTTEIAIIVVPLMLTQLILGIITVYIDANLVTITTLLIVLFLWVFTFLGFAPLHFKISEGKSNQKLLLLLIQRNWTRTFLWSGLFLLHIWMYF